jgi:hypothetical protein
MQWEKEAGDLELVGPKAIALDRKKEPCAMPLSRNPAGA